MAKPNLQPTLTGKNFTVRPIRPDDWEGLFAVASDPELWAQHPAKDRYKEEVFRDFFDAAIQSESAFVFIDNATGALVGSSRYNGYDAVNSEIEIGWSFIARSHWGGAANAEVKTLMLSAAFEFVDTVIFWVGETNLRSRGAMQKIGGKLREGLHYRSLAGDAAHVIFEIRRADFRP